MSKVREAKYLDDYISIGEYSDLIHYQKIFCPECYKAPIHIVRKQDTRPYFASNRKEEHLTDCQHYEEFVKNKILIKLIQSKSQEDQNRLKFLIESNLNASIRLLLMSTDNESLTTKPNSSINFKSKAASSTSDKYKKESISRVSIKNLKRRTDHIDNHIVIYGQAELEVKIHNSIDKQTNKIYRAKQLIFRLGSKLVFSIFLSRFQTEYFKREVGTHNVIFAVFGELKTNNGFLNLKITSTENLKTIDN